MYCLCATLASCFVKSDNKLRGSLSHDSVYQHSPRTQYIYSFLIVVCLLFSNNAMLEAACSSDDSKLHQWTTGSQLLAARHRKTLDLYKSVLIWFWNILVLLHKMGVWIRTQFNLNIYPFTVVKHQSKLPWWSAVIFTETTHVHCLWDASCCQC